MHQKEINCRRDATPAIADDLLFFRRVARFEDCERFSKTNEALGLWIDKACGRYIHAAGHAAGAAVSTGLQAAMELGAKSVHDHGTWSTDCSHCIVLVDEQARSRSRLEGSGRITFRIATLGHAAFCLPLVESSIQNRHIVEAERAKHPPKTG